MPVSKSPDGSFDDVAANLALDELNERQPYPFHNGHKIHSKSAGGVIRYYIHSDALEDIGKVRVIGPDPDGVAYVDGLMVDERHRRRGIAKALLQAIITDMEGVGARVEPAPNIDWNKASVGLMQSLIKPADIIAMFNDRLRSTGVPPADPTLQVLLLVPVFVPPPQASLQPLQLQELQRLQPQSLLPA